MRQFHSVSFVVIVTFWSSVSAVDGREPESTKPTYQLDGLWKSDWELTEKHLRKECRMSGKTIAWLGEILGKMTVEYRGNHSIAVMPELRLQREDREVILDGWTREGVYKPIGRTRTQIAVVMDGVKGVEGFDDDSIMIINFDDADTYWVYCGYSQLVSLHYREYFRRVKLPTYVEP